LAAAHRQRSKASGRFVNHHAKLAVIATFGLLGFCYVASLAATVIIVGPSGFTDAVFRIPDFVVLFVAAAVEAVGCFVVAVLSFGSRRSTAGCLGLAVLLAVGGVVILTGVPARAPVPGLWPIALAGIALHLLGIFLAWVRVRNEAF